MACLKLAYAPEVTTDHDPALAVPSGSDAPYHGGEGDLAAVIAGYPGPALLITRDHTVLAANRAGLAMLAEDADWWRDTAVWRSAMFSGMSGQRSNELARPSSNGRGVQEWLSVLLALPPQPRLLVLGRDVTLERRLRRTLTESRQRYKDLVEISSDFAWETGPDGRFVFVSPGGALGYAAEEIVGRHPSDLIDTDDGLPLPFTAHRPIDRVEIWLRAANGSPCYLQTSAKPLFSADGNWIGARGLCRDLTAQALRSAELGLVLNRERVLNRIVHTLRDQLDASKALDVAARETIQALDGLGCTIHRLASDGTAGLIASSGDLVKDRAEATALSALLREVADQEAPIERPVGNIVLLACRTRFGQTVNGMVTVWRDMAKPWDHDSRELISGVADRIGITNAQLTYQEHLRHLSERDSLTGLFNRRTFLERLGEMLTWRDFGSSALLYIDLDNFKAVNDLRGHTQGDEVLRAVGELVTAGTRPGDLCGRMGGDEFVLWFSRTDSAGAVVVANRLLAGIARLRNLSANEAHPLGMSIGIAMHHPGDVEGVESLIERADSAMYLAKTQGKGNFSLAPDFAPELSTATSAPKELSP